MRVGDDPAAVVEQADARAGVAGRGGQRRAAVGQARATGIGGEERAHQLALVDHVALERGEQLALVLAGEHDARQRHGDDDHVDQQQPVADARQVDGEAADHRQR